MSVQIYGLKNCDKCRAALKSYDQEGVTTAFIDIRQDAHLEVLIPHWIEAVGAKALINTRSTTWRNLNEDERARAQSDPVSLLLSHPTLIKRPVIFADDEISVGWPQPN